VNVTVDPAGKGVSGAEVKIAFDASVVECEDVSPGELLGDSPVQGIKEIDNENGTVWYALARNRSDSTPVPTEEGTFAVLSFKVKEDASEGTYYLRITSAKLTDENFNYISPIEIKNGTFTIVPPIVPTPAYITVSPSTATLNVGETGVFTATAYDGNGNPIEGVLINWTSTNETVGTVRPTASITDENGVARTNFTAISPGNTTVTAGNLTDAGWIIGYADVTVIQDETPPTTEVIATPPEPATGWWNSSVMLTFHRYDDLSGVDYTAYKIGEAPWAYESGDADFTVNITEEGCTTVLYYSVDKAGNNETAALGYIPNMTVCIDKTEPLITSVQIDKYEVPPGDIINVTVKANDALSGIWKVTVNGFSLTLMDDAWYGNITAPLLPGIYNVTVEAIDHAWNIALNNTVQYVVVDEEPPLVMNATAKPSMILSDTGRARPEGTNISTLFVRVTDNVKVESVKIDLSPIKGPGYESVEMAPVGGGWYAVQTNAVTGVNETHCLLVNATDVNGNFNNSVCIRLEVLRRGDVVRDNEVNMGDALYIARYSVGLEEPIPDEITFMLVGDVAPAEGDRIVDMGDALYIARYSVGLEPEP